MDLATAQSHLDAWLAADLAVSTGQSYAIGEVAVTRVDATRIRNQITYWQGVVASLTAQAVGGNAGPALATFGTVR